MSWCGSPWRAISRPARRLYHESRPELRPDVRDPEREQRGEGKNHERVSLEPGFDLAMSRRGLDPPLVPVKSGRLWPGRSSGIDSVTAASPP